LVIFGNYSEFEKGVKWIIENIDFNKDLNVSLFETNIRILGGLLSGLKFFFKITFNSTFFG
jgi:hypothetical protein